MSHFTNNETFKVENDGEWISIKKALSVAERNRMIDELIITTGKEVETKYGSYITSMLELVIVDWHLLDDDKEIPFDKNLIKSFKADDVLIDKVLTEIGTRYPLGTNGSTKI